jgi:hypothetical protein
MCAATMGAIFFFQDPMDAHPHTADIECLNRQTNVHNIIVCTNPSSAHAMTFALRQALRTGETSMVPSFLFTCESPSVKEYKDRQAAVLVENRGSSSDRRLQQSNQQERGLLDDTSGNDFASNDAGQQNDPLLTSPRITKRVIKAALLSAEANTIVKNEKENFVIDLGEE